MRLDEAPLEWNFDGLIGPTHNYSGLAPGNLASLAHRSRTSNPRAAAQEGLAKMRLMHSLGVPQAFLPPPLRPDIGLLRRLGFGGDEAAVLWAASRDAPHLLAAAWSASSMWTANAATVCPSSDATDRRVHFTPANLVTSLHRANESADTASTLRAVFNNPEYFTHHEPLPASLDLGDEGAANHTRFTPSPDQTGLHLFVYGKGDEREGQGPRRFPARQTRAASEAVARLCRIDASRVVLARQHPDAIDAGVFHNDVIAVGNGDLLLTHEQAFSRQEQVVDDLRRASNDRLRVVTVASKTLSLDEAVTSYLFNSQLVTTGDGQTVLIAPEQCERHPSVGRVLSEWRAEGVIDAVHYADVGESMRNGGGPACLRLRAPLTSAEAQAFNRGVVFDEASDRWLSEFIDRHYRDSLAPGDLADPQLAAEARDARDELIRFAGL